MSDAGAPPTPWDDALYPCADTHWPVLRACIEATDLPAGIGPPVLELGCGDGSTRQLHDLLLGRRLRRRLVSVESSPIWAAKYRHLAEEYHEIRLVQTSMDADWDALVHPPDRAERYAVALVDNGPTPEHRIRALLYLARLVDLLVVHDVETASYGWHRVLGAFPYARIFRGVRPWTGVFSSFRDPAPILAPVEARYPGWVDALGDRHLDDPPQGPLFEKAT